MKKANGKVRAWSRGRLRRRHWVTEIGKRIISRVRRKLSMTRYLSVFRGGLSLSAVCGPCGTRPALSLCFCDRHRVNMLPDKVGRRLRVGTKVSGLVYEVFVEEKIVRVIKMWTHYDVYFARRRLRISSSCSAALRTRNETSPASRSVVWFNSSCLPFK